MAFVVPLATSIGGAFGASGAAATAIGSAVMATSVAGVATSAYGKYRAGKIAQQRYNYQASANEAQAMQAGYQVDAELNATRREEEQMRKRQIQLQDSVIASAAASGLQISGSVEDLILFNMIETEKDIQMAGYQGRVRAYQAGSESRNYLTEARGQRIAGRNARKMANLEAGASFLSDATSLGLTFASFGD